MNKINKGSINLYESKIFDNEHASIIADSSKIVISKSDFYIKNKLTSDFKFTNNLKLKNIFINISHLILINKLEKIHSRLIQINDYDTFILKQSQLSCHKPISCIQLI